MAEITRDLIKTLRDEIDDTLKSVAEKYGVTIKAGNASFIPGGTGTLKLEIASIVEGKTISKIEEDFKHYCYRWGMNPIHLGRTFKSWDGTVYKIVGCKPRSHKYPILATNPSGKRFKFPAEQVRKALYQNDDSVDPNFDKYEYDLERRIAEAEGRD